MPIELAWSDGSTGEGTKSLSFPLAHRTSGLDEAYCDVKVNDTFSAVITIQALEDRRTKTFLMVTPWVSIICFRGRVIGLYDERIVDIREMKLGGVILDQIIWQDHVVLIGRQRFAVVGPGGPVIQMHSVAYVDGASLKGDKLILCGESQRAELYSEEYDLLELVSQIKAN